MTSVCMCVWGCCSAVTEDALANLPCVVQRIGDDTVYEVSVDTEVVAPVQWATLARTTSPSDAGDGGTILFTASPAPAEAALGSFKSTGSAADKPGGCVIS